ncbi:MAG: preprotein translocase subunit SecY [Candidatus Omnitrophica bacterium]|nr:preprotein translocase subunit SecY [Candidatus Omnitrophota bacterium]
MVGEFFKAFVNIFKIEDLRKKVLFTLLIFIVYRIGAHIPTPGVDGKALARFFEMMSRSQGGSLFGIMNLFSGGAMQQMTIFALGIMPYISASIILQLLTVVIPALERLSKEGDEGRKKIIQYTRYTTVGLALIQSFFISLWLENPNAFQGIVIVQNPGWGFRLLTMLTFTTGTAFIMWLGEQIDESGIGNGVSLIITIGIISRMPQAFFQTIALLSPLDPSQRVFGWWKLGLMLSLVVFTTVAVIYIIQGQRKIPVQYAKRVIGRKVYGGQSTYLPLKVNQAGVIPIIFAQSVILFPATIAGFVANPYLQTIATFLSSGKPGYFILYPLLIIFFSYFYTAITFNPVEVAENLKKYGGFIPGVRPGKTTAEYLDFMMTRIVLFGSVFLALVAIFPSIVTISLKIPFLVASFMGGTGLLIVVGVILDTMKAIESQLLMRHYDGFIKKGKLKARR